MAIFVLIARILYHYEKKYPNNAFGGRACLAYLGANYLA